MNFTCPRRIEDGRAEDRSVFAGDGPNMDKYREDDTCSYCGSISGDKLMAVLEEGSVKVGPTDKSYKIYVDLPNPAAGKLHIVGWSNAANPAGMTRVKDTDLTNVDTSGWSTLGPYDWIQVAPHGPIQRAKFYFQHLSAQQKQRFVKLLNLGKIQFGYPGHFYTQPYFISYEM